MHTRQFHAAAQDFIKTIKPLLGEYDITFMDASGAVLASSIPGRAGFLHHGAAEAARKKKPVAIHAGNIADYHGSYEGVCFPVIKNDALLGVVGIRGVPDEVEPTAGLLAACVGLYLGHNVGEVRARLRRDMRQSLLESVTGDAPPPPETIREKGRELGIDCGLPVRVVAVRAPLPLPELEKAATGGDWFDDARDLAGVFGGVVLIARHVPDGASIDMAAEQLRDSLRRSLRGGGDVGIGIGSLCAAWSQTRFSRQEATALACLGDGVRSIDSPAGRMTYLLGGTLRQGETERCLERLDSALRQGSGEKNYRQTMRTLRAYCDADCHGGQAAKRLGIHKNTMNYRMNKIVSLLGLEHEEAFVREFFLRLLVLRDWSEEVTAVNR